LLEVFGEAAVSAQPCQRPLDDPTAREDHETLGRIGTLDDLDGPFADPAQRLPELVARIAAIGEDMAQPREALDDLGQHQRRTVAVLDVGGVDHGVDQITLGVGQDEALAALGLLARIVTPWPAALRQAQEILSVVLTLWQPAPDLIRGSLPHWARPRARSSRARSATGRD
jgi:hypothetical protein